MTNLESLIKDNKLPNIKTWNKDRIACKLLQSTTILMVIMFQQVRQLANRKRGSSQNLQKLKRKREEIGGGGPWSEGIG
jgi:hypothetical protein